MENTLLWLQEMEDNNESWVKISSVISILKKEQEKAINNTLCSEQLKDKYSEDFAYFIEKKVKEQKIGSIYWYKGTVYTDLDKFFKEYQKSTKPLIV